MFLDLFEQIWAAWEERLRTERSIDFEDMLNLATDHIEQGRWVSPFELVMVDEFQDASHARARFAAALVREPNRHLFAVGDDWQSINRFAGADLGVMTNFEARFGHATRLKLETTFRCPQSLCDISSAFVQVNPRQIPKQVRSAKQDVAEPVRILHVANKAEDIRAAVEARVQELSTANRTGKRQAIFLLGRYGTDEAYMPRNFDSRRVTIEFKTAHGSKGLEAHHVILPKMTSETMGFPCRLTDDQVFQLVMPEGDSYEFAEERRLFYVALTRARESVTLLTTLRNASPFVTELVRTHKREVHLPDGSLYSTKVCSTCEDGFMVLRRNSKGKPFLGCTNFPSCTNTEDIASKAPTRRVRSARKGTRKWERR